MCLIPCQNINSLLVLTIVLNILYDDSLVTSSPVNGSEAIKSIFGTVVPVHEVKTTKNLTNENFAEGGLIQEHSTKNISKIIEKPPNVQDGTHSKSKYKSVPSPSPLDNKTEVTTTTTLKTTISIKLDDANSNLLLGVPEVVHINGTSSIKPRKGVYYNKIVPRKGVDIDSESYSSSIEESDSCLWTVSQECHQAFSGNGKNLTCVCCEIKESPLNTNNNNSNCNNCVPVYNKTCNCQDLCARDHFHNAESKSPSSTPQTVTNQKTADTDLKSASTERSPGESQKPKKSNAHGSLLSYENKLVHISKKLKPQITRVPYDADIESSDFLVDSKREILLPVTASLLLVPLIGILLFFIWRKSKDYWDKRYYRKMDFLIDGIYND